MVLDSIQSANAIGYIDRLEAENEVKSSLINVLTIDRNECDAQLSNYKEQTTLLKAANDAFLEAYGNERVRADKNYADLQKSLKRERIYLMAMPAVLIIGLLL